LIHKFLIQIIALKEKNKKPFKRKDKNII